MSKQASSMFGQSVAMASITAVTRYSRVEALSSVQLTQMSAICKNYRNTNFPTAVNQPLDASIMD